MITVYGAIEAGGTKFVCAVGDENLQVIKRVNFPTTTPEETMKQVYEFFDQYQLKAIGIGSFGPIDVNPKSKTYGYIKNTPKPAWIDFDFVGAIKHRYNIPVGWTTDVNAAALCEATKGIGIGLKSVLYLTVGTGIGGGAVLNGKIVEGFGHPEMGHIMVQPHPNDTFQGSCPYHGNCAEGMAAGPSIDARLNKKGYEIEQNHEVWDYLAFYLAQALHTYTLILRPEIIVLGGGVMKGGSLLQKVKTELTRIIGNYVDIPPIDQYIQPPILGDNAGIIGGLILARDHSYSLEMINPMPETAHVTDPFSVFYPGFMESNNYRIPALLYTEGNTLIAGIDRRVENGADSPNNIDAVIRRSFDQGTTWEEDGIVINDYPDQASNIDLSLLQDKSNGRIFALVAGYPHGAGLMGGFGKNAYKGTGFKTIDGKKFMFLIDEGGSEYTVREEGKVYDSAGELTSFTVVQGRNLYQDGEKINNIFSETSPLKPFKTSYLELYSSDDEGETWEGPIDLNEQVKEEWMIFLGAGPGNGIQIAEGPYQGRLVFPVYFLNDNNMQASAVIYSDDNGKTWHRGESPNEGRVVGDGKVIYEKDFIDASYEITECQVVEIPDGQLKLFMRNRSGYAQIATSFDGGDTWDSEVVTETALVAPYSQMSAIRYNGQIGGKDAVVFSSASDSRNRINGAVRIGLIEETGTYENGRIKYSFDWKYEQLVKEGAYGYSSLTNLPNGEIGLFYEGTPNTVMDFIKFNIDYIKWEKMKQASKLEI